MQHQSFSATLAEQHRDQLRRQAQQTPWAHDARPASRPRWRTVALHWWRPATRTASAQP
jgi:hypothetical protein